MRTPPLSTTTPAAPPIARFPFRATAQRICARAAVALLAAAAAITPLAYNLVTAPDERIPTGAIVTSAAFALVFLAAALALYATLDGALQQIARLYGIGTWTYMVLGVVCALFPPLAVVLAVLVALDVSQAVDNGHLRRRSAR